MRTLPLFCLLLLCCSLPTVASGLTVTSISPAVAYADSTRTYDVYGTGFAVGAQVTLTPAAGGTAIAATGEDWVDFTHLQCTVTVPPGAVTGLYDVTVSNPRDTGSGSMANAFSVYPRPVVTGIVPSQAQILSSPSLFTAHLSGTGFVTGAEVYLVGGTGGITWIFATGETVISPTQLDCTFSVPYDAYPGPYDVYVRSHPNLDYVLARTDAFTVIAPTPAITLVSPAWALPGQTLTIDVIGSGFTNGAEVRVEGGPSGNLMIIPAMGETFVSPFRIQCALAIPSDAYIGQYTVFLRNPGGEWVYKSNAFTVTAPVPTVTGISPSSADPGQTLSTVYVTGTGFVAGVEVRLEADDTEYSLVINATDEVRVNATTVRCALAIPASAPPGPYLVFARNPGTVWSAPGPFSFAVHTPVPAVTEISPGMALPGQVMQIVYVTGSGFAGGAQVRIRGGTGGTTEIGATGETWVNATAIRCSITVPFDAWPGPYSVEVMNLYGGWVSRPGTFAVVAPVPTISGVSPSSAYPGQTLTSFNVSGTGLANGAEVRVEGGTGGTTMVEATGETFVSLSQIRCTLAIPQNAYPGRYHVSVRNPGGQWATYAGAFFVMAPIPFVYGTAPASAAPGETLPTVYVHVSGLTNGAQVILMGGPGDDFAIDATNETFINSSTMRCSLAIPPDAPLGAYTVCIRMPGSPDRLFEGVLDTFTVTAPIPTVSGISPSRAYPGQTLSTVYVLGTGFAQGASVVIGPPTGYTGPVIDAADETYVNTTAIRCSLAIPASAPSGLYSVSVANIGNHVPATRGRAFTVLAPTPGVTAVSPDSAVPGDVLNSVIVSGTNFTTGAEVTMHGGTGGTTTIEATDETFVSPTQVRCSLAIPADAYPGSYTVSVTNPPAYFMDPSPTGSRAGAFTVIAPTPTLMGIVPSTATRGQTLTTVNVTGTGFATGASVILRRAGSADIQATDEIVVSPSLITCRLAVPPDAATGSWNVVVTNLGGPSGTLTGGFTVAPDIDTTPPASVTGLRPLGWNATSITWVWTDPPDADFVKVRVYQDGNFKADVDRDVQTYSLTGLAPLTGYRLDTRTCDLAGNCNATLVSNWATTAPRPVGPVADFTANVTSGPAPLAVRFTDASTGMPTSWSWTFGDGGASTLRDPSHTYTSAGPYTVTLEVSNGDGSDSEVKTGFITVTAPPGVVMVPGGSGIPRDHEPDGLYEDVNGNGRKDFADVVLYFNQMSWIADNEPISAFDYNGNGRIDFADVVWLFNHL